MAKTGFVGFGNMGSVLVKSLLGSKGLLPEDLWVHTRSPEKLGPLLHQYPQVKVTSSVEDAVRDSSYLFIVNQLRLKPRPKERWEPYPGLKAGVSATVLGGLQTLSKTR
jgi:pyrroline-5-carboxylate reductase